MSKRQGPPKHQNRYAWKPNLGQKINETIAPRTSAYVLSAAHVLMSLSEGMRMRRKVNASH
ncbi:hypothetical protein Zm00014a_026492 [Zea mays]|uniref:Uncharacterized protein n=1 Tax=Zea mays TaxID=4577 RepID=A0A3L6FB49_MAIZE|nr:hypothetical protein Zm00014a_026492 [Zea mays]